MNLEQNISNLQNLAQNAAEKLTVQVRLPEANRLRADVLNRITIDGKASDGTTIGAYSHKPASYSRKQFVKTGVFKPQGKNGKRKDAKTMYLIEGYHQLRGIQGMDNSKVVLDYSGDLRLDYQQETQGTTIVFGFTKESEAIKHKAVEKKYGKKIFPATEEELTDYNKRCAAAYSEITSRILKA